MGTAQKEVSRKTRRTRPSERLGQAYIFSVPKSSSKVVFDIKLSSMSSIERNG